MSSNSHLFGLELTGPKELWERMKIYVHLYLYNEEGELLELAQFERITTPPKGSFWEITAPNKAATARLCLYLIPANFPLSDNVADSPPIPLEVRLLRSGEQLQTLQRQVNQWGGDQLLDLPFQ